MEGVEEEFEVAELKKETLLKEIENVHKVSSSLLLFSLQWKDLELRYDGLKKRVEERYEEAKMSVREQSEEAQKVLESREMEILKKEKNLIGLRTGIFQEVGKKRKDLLAMKGKVEEAKKITERAEKAVDCKEKKVKEMELKADEAMKKLERRTKVVEWKEKRVEEIRNGALLKEDETAKLRELVNRNLSEVKLGEVKLRLLEGKVDQRLKELEAKEERVNKLVRLSNEQCKNLEVKDREFYMKRKAVEKLLEELNLKEKLLVSFHGEIDQRFFEVEEKEKSLKLIQVNIDQSRAELELREKCLILAQEEIDQRTRKLDMKEKSLDSLTQRIDQCSAELKAKETSYESKEGEIDAHVVVLKVKEKYLDSVQKEVDQYGKELNAKQKFLGLLEKEITQRSAELDTREKSLESTQKAIHKGFAELEAKEKCAEDQINERIAELEAKEKSSTERSQEIELKEKSLRFLRQSVEGQVQLFMNHLKEQFAEPESKERQLGSIQKVIDQCLEDAITESYKELDLKEKQIFLMQQSLDDRYKELEQREKRISDNILHRQIKAEEPPFLLGNKAPSSISADIRGCITMDGKDLQIFLNKQLRESKSIRHEVPIALQMSSNPAKLVLDAMQGFYPPHLKDGNIEFEVGVVRESCIFLLQLLRRMSPIINSCVKEEAIKLLIDWKRRMKPEGNDPLEVLAFLEIIATYELTNTIDAAELLSYIERVGVLGENMELHKALGFAEIVPSNAICYSSVKSAQPDCSKVCQASELVCSNEVCTSIDGKSMLLLLKEHMNNQEILLDKVSAALGLSPDSVQLVLDALKLYSSQHLQVKGYKKLGGSFLPGCVLLLDQLIKIVPKVEPDVRDEAMKLACEWKQKLIDGAADSPLAVLAFLQLLVAYGLGSAFSEEVVVVFLMDIAEHEDANYLCDLLGLREKVSDYIEELVQKEQGLEAIKYIRAFELERKFPLVPLLQEHLNRCRGDANRMYRSRGSSPAALKEAANIEIAGLRDVIKCIMHHKLEHEYPPDKLEECIRQLESKISKRKRAAKGQFRKPQRPFKRCKTVQLAEDVPRTSRSFGDQGSRPFEDRGLISFGDQVAKPFEDQGSRSFGDQSSIPFEDQGSRSFGDQSSIPFEDQGSRSFGDQSSIPFGDQGSGPFEDRGPGKTFNQSGFSRFQHRLGPQVHESPASAYPPSPMPHYTGTAELRYGKPPSYPYKSSKYRSL